MDQELLVDQRVEDGEKLVTLLVRDGFNVTAAFWGNAVDTYFWYLYLANDGVDATNFGEYFRRLYDSWGKIPDTSVAISELKLLNTTDPIVRDAIQIRDRRPGRLAIRAENRTLGSHKFKELYIYPKLGDMTRTEVMQTVAELISRGQPSTVTLANGGTFEGVPCGIRNSGGIVQLDFVDTVGATRTLSADQVLSLH